MYSCFEKGFRSDTKLLSTFSSGTSSDSLSSSNQSLSSGLWIDDRKTSHKSRTRNSPIITTTLAATRVRRRPLKMKKKNNSLGSSASSSSDSSSKITSSSSVSSISSALNSSDNDLYLYDQSTTALNESYAKLDKNGLLNRYIANSTDDNQILSDIPYQNFDTMCKEIYYNIFLKMEVELNLDITN